MKSFVAAILLSAVFFSQDAAAQVPQDPPRALYQTDTGVSMLDLGYVYSNVDLAMGPFVLERSYASQRFTSSEYFDRSWTHNYDMWIRSSILHNEWHTAVFLGRSIHKFAGSLTLNYPENDEVGTSATLVNGLPVFTDRDGTIYQFLAIQNGAAKLSSITKPSGERQTFNYTSGLLKYVESNLGFALVFDYNGSRVSAACIFNTSQTYVNISTSCASAALKTSYGYTGSSLTSFSDVRGKVTGFQYDYSTGAGYLTCVTKPNSSVCPITNVYATHYTFQTVVQQNLADGSIWHYSCTCGDEGRADPDNFYPIETTTITDPANKVSGMTFKAGTPYTVTDGNGHTRTWEFFGRFPVKVTEPEGNYSVASFNSRMVPNASTSRAKAGSSLADIVTGAKTFPSDCSNTITCNKPLTIADAKGNITDYAYDQTHGGVLSEMRPAPSAGAARPLKLFTYVQKYAWVKNSGGSLIPASAPVWLPATETLCQTYAGSSTATCDPAATVTVTTYEYGADGTADNLRPRGVVVSSGGVNLRTCYGYDWKGNKIWETSPRAGLAVCQ